MSIKEKQAMVAALSNSIRDEVLEKLGKMPEDWDGHELRRFLFDKWEREVTGKMKDKRGRRYREYLNEVLVRNL